MERCLNATKSIVDFVSICDTGSTDHTPEIIENWCKENEIRTVHHEPFKNFGYNRSLAVSLAQNISRSRLFINIRCRYDIRS